MLVAALLFAFAATEAKARSQQTWICLKNDTNERKPILVEDIQNDHWDGLSRPDHNWNGTYVEVGQTRCERAEVNFFGHREFSFVISGRSFPHKISLQYWDGDYYGWMAEVTMSLAESILLGNGSIETPPWYSFDNWRFQFPSRCLVAKQGFCALYTIQDIP